MRADRDPDVDGLAWFLYTYLPDVGAVRSYADVEEALYTLTTTEYEIASTLFNDGWLGSLEELLRTAKALA